MPKNTRNKEAKYEMTKEYVQNVGATIASEQLAMAAEREQMAGYKYRVRPSSHRPGEWSSSEESSEDYVDLTADQMSFEDKMNWLEMQREMVLRE